MSEPNNDSISEPNNDSISEPNIENKVLPFYKEWSFWFVVIYLLFIVIYTVLYIRSDGENFMLSSNELGDFLAGSFAPLAFLFLYLGYKQQGIELKQNTKALLMQAKELNISNATLKQQVEEMQKSVETQKNMFLLAERQYSDSIDEKARSSTPQLSLIGSKYLQTGQSFGASELEQRFTLTLKAINKEIKNLKIRSNFWNITKGGGSYDNSVVSEINSIEINKPLTFIFYIRSNTVPFQNNILNIDYYDEVGNKYLKKFQLFKNDDQVVLFSEITDNF